MSLNIVVDQNIPLAHELLGPLSSQPLVFVDGRKLKRDQLMCCDVLLVRSVTKVSEALLEGTPVRFVGTATAGTNHIDIDYLESKGIAWASAPGSNAESVAEWVLSALYYLEKKGSFSKTHKVGVIGYGHVGQALTSKLTALGIEWVAVDPPRKKITQEEFLQDQSALYDCDLLTYHVPYSKEGIYKTENMVNAEFLQKMQKPFVFINACRGEVVQEDHLLEAFKSGQIRDLVLDVFWDEPAPRMELLEACFLATPHVAGYSTTAKYRGTLMIAQALQNYLGHRINTLTLPTPVTSLEYANYEKNILEVYDIHADFERFKATWKTENTEEGTKSQDRALLFDALRKNYPKRWEYSDFKIPEKNELLEALGFLVS